MITFALHPVASAAESALPGSAETIHSRSIVFAVDPVVGQAYLSAPDAKPGQAHSLSIVNLGTGLPAGQVGVPSAPSAISVNPFSGLVYLASKTDNTVSILHGASQR